MMKRSLALAALTAIVLATIAAGLLVETPSRDTRKAPLLPPPGEVAAAHLPFGLITPPRPMPEALLTFDDGSTGRLSDRLKGEWTFAQLMFAGCSTTCPIQGAIFEETQARLQETGMPARLLSISIDPIGDDAANLSRWRGLFNAGDRWTAAVPTLDELGPIIDSLQGRGKGIDIHDARVYLIAPDGFLVYASEDLPTPDALIAILKDAMAHHAAAGSS